MLWGAKFSMMSLLGMCSLVVGRDALCFFACPGNLALCQGSVRPAVNIRRSYPPALGGHGPMSMANARSTGYGVLSPPRSSQDYILDTFDPEEEEDELSNEAMLQIILSETPDQEVNLLVWKCLGYEQDQATGEWRNDNCFPKWREKYPNPPDLIGVKRNYTYEIDRPVQKANQAIVASIPMKYKQGIKEHLRPLGFTGFKLDELTPNKTRRAQCVNWMLYYREALRGKTIEQLRAEREMEKANEEFPKVVGPESLQRRDDDQGTMKEQTTWKYPNKPII